MFIIHLEKGKPPIWDTMLKRLNAKSHKRLSKCSTLVTQHQDDFTMAALTDSSGRIISMGCSKRCVKDQKDNEIGENIAIARAMRAV